MESNNVAYNNAIFKFGQLNQDLNWTPILFKQSSPLVFYISKNILPLRDCISFKIDSQEVFENIKETLAQCYSLESKFEELNNLYVPVYLSIPIITFTKREMRKSILQSNLKSDLLKSNTDFNYFESVHYFTVKTTKEFFKAELTRTTGIQYFQLDSLPINLILNGHEVETVCKNCKFNKFDMDDKKDCLLYTNLFDCIINTNSEPKNQEDKQ